MVSPEQLLLMAIIIRAHRDWINRPRSALKDIAPLGFSSLEEELRDFVTAQCREYLDWLGVEASPEKLLDGGTGDVPASPPSFPPRSGRGTSPDYR